MVKPRPNLSITLPRNFVFHFTDGQAPKTPERELEMPKPPSPRVHRVSRRAAQPSVAAYDIFTNTSKTLNATPDVPIPAIEATAASGGESSRPSFLQRFTEPAIGYLAAPNSVQQRRFGSAPRTPSLKLPAFGGDVSDSERSQIGASIPRPMSACSSLSDSSDASDCSSTTHFSLSGGSCTSPESDASDPFFPASEKASPTRASFSHIMPSTIKTHTRSKGLNVAWTPEMDQHLWRTYMIYLQDPKVTPFKTLPGSPPPLGVCHRVSREARRTWRGRRNGNAKAAESDMHLTRVASMKSGREGSPDTIRAERSGSTTPTIKDSSYIKWPKSGASTRRRLRELCKRKATIAPHYQRLLQTRSPSPFNSSSPRSVRMSSPATESHHSPFGTRSVRLSLATSTSTTMQPDGPLAQLSSDNHLPQPQIQLTIPEANIPFASPAPIPSELDNDVPMRERTPELPRLGSPFACHTWGPGRMRHQNLRPTTPEMQTERAIALQGPTLGSPIQLHRTFPYPSTHKRRAQRELETELSPGGTNMQNHVLEGLFTNSDQDYTAIRRVRTRGFTTGERSVGKQMASMFNPAEAVPPVPALPAMNAFANGTPLNNGSRVTNGSASTGISGLQAPFAAAADVPRLGSPFPGISGRPSRSRRHLASASLSAYPSFEQRLGNPDPFQSSPYEGYRGN
ncbi:hypothetical protein MMC25_007316 [Agyrium rufum]|nr:hypothetical protein [Agyrium rufum]